ncbi:hypothetical protein AMK68_03640, partial [candidate division KD3-62 bacterium DG_56]
MRSRLTSGHCCGHCLAHRWRRRHLGQARHGRLDRAHAPQLGLAVGTIAQVRLQPRDRCRRQPAIGVGVNLLAGL